MNKTYRWMVACAVMIGIAAAVFLCMPFRNDDRRNHGQSPSVSGAEANPSGPDSGKRVRNHHGGRERRKGAESTRARAKRPDKSAGSKSPDEKPEIEVDDDELSPEELTLKEAIEKSLDDEDLAAARALAAQAMAVSNTDIRQAMVDTLGWFGVKALPEITPFLADPDEDVRDAALSEWSTAISDINDEGEKLGVVELAMHVLTNEDALEDISGEYIGTDEKLAVESLLRVIEAGGSKNGIAKAKETYEFVTGEEFVDRAAAEKWIAEEYEPPTKE